MPTSFTAATTRTATAGRRSDRTELLPIAHVITSPETQLSYQIERLLGEGGFGQVYLARRLGRSTAVPEVICIKVSQRIDGWLREAYFGQLLDGHPRAIRVFDAFPVTSSGRSILYCLAIEYAQYGDLSAFLKRSDRPWAESVALTNQRAFLLPHTDPANPADAHAVDADGAGGSFLVLEQRAK